MEARPVWEYISCGTALRYLQDAREGYPFHQRGHVLSNINLLMANLKRFKFSVTTRAAGDLAKFRDTLEETPEGYRLTADEATKLTQMVSILRRTLQAEAEGSVAYVLLEKRFEVSKLLSGIWELLDDGVYAWLPDIAKHDFNEGGRCIALELPTAAAFHFLRGPESALRAFYMTLVKRDRADLMWGSMVTSLRKRSRNRPPDELLNHLDNIRRSFRNPTQHPEKIYDIQEAQNLFSLCADVLGRMYRFVAE